MERLFQGKQEMSAQNILQVIRIETQNEILRNYFTSYITQADFDILVGFLRFTTGLYYSAEFRLWVDALPRQKLQDLRQLHEVSDEVASGAHLQPHDRSSFVQIVRANEKAAGHCLHLRKLGLWLRMKEIKQ